MSLFSRTSNLTDGDEARELREARVRAARRCQAWTEVTPAERLIPRGPKRYGWRVDSGDSDGVFVLHTGAVFLRDSASIVADRSPLWFIVDRDGDVVVYERALGNKTWSDVIRANPELAGT